MSTVKNETTLKSSGLEKGTFVRAIGLSFAKLLPHKMIGNPVMFLVYIATLICSVALVVGAATGGAHSAAAAGTSGVTAHAVGATGGGLGFEIQIVVWLWLTLLFANYAEAIAELQGKAKADSLRALRETLQARKIVENEEYTVVASKLKAGDLVVCLPGDFIPADGEIIEGAATIDESSVTGESAPVIRESGGDRSAVTGGTKVLSDRVVIRISAGPGESFLDRMIGLIEASTRRKTPSEIALNIVLAALSIVFLAVVLTLYPLQAYSVAEGKAGELPTVFTLTALLVCLIPTTIGGLLSAIGISGIIRMMRKNVIAVSGKAVETAGDVDTIVMDKTGTITFGNRMAVEIVPAPGIEKHMVYQAAYTASAADETPEGRSTLSLAAKEGVETASATHHAQYATFVTFSARTRMSGVDFSDGRPSLRKGALSAVESFVKERGGEVPQEVRSFCELISSRGGTPLVVSSGARVLGTIHLKDVVKPEIKERFARLRAMGIRTIMITGDNPLTAAAIAAEAGVDDFVAEAKPETKMELIEREQASGHVVAMIGDGTNDAPAIARADVGVAMATGTQAAREAGSMVDLDNDPAKLGVIIETGKQLLMTRGSLATFSIANDVAKYFSILPAFFSGLYAVAGGVGVAAGAVHGALDAWNVMALSNPRSAILSAVIFNALIIVALIPLALRGVRYRPSDAQTILRKNILIYGLGGVLVPFVGIKIIDIVVSALGLA